MENYVQNFVMGNVSREWMKSECLPSKFYCQLNRLPESSMKRPCILKNPEDHFIRNINKQSLNDAQSLNDKKTYQQDPTRVVGHEKSYNYAYEVIKTEIFNGNTICESYCNKEKNESVEMSTKKNIQVLGYISKVETIANEKFTFEPNTQNHSFYSSFSEDIDIKNEIKEETENNEYLMDNTSEIDIYEHEVLTSTANTQNDLFEQDRYCVKDFVATFTDPDICGNRQRMTNKNTEKHSDLIDIKPTMSSDVNNARGNIKDVGGVQLDNYNVKLEALQDSYCALKVNAEDTAMDIKPLLIHDIIDANEESCNLKNAHGSNLGLNENDKSRHEVVALKCTVCFKAFLTESAYNDHMVMKHIKRNILQAETDDILINKQSLTTQDIEVLKERGSTSQKSVSQTNVRYVDITAQKDVKLNKTRSVKPSKLKKTKHKSCTVDQKTKTCTLNDKQWVRNNKKLVSLQKNRINANASEIKTDLYNSETEHENNLKYGYKDVFSGFEFKYSCIICSFNTNVKKWMRSHAIIHLENSTEDTLVCDYCDYITKIKARLIVHIKTHMTEIRYTCKICSYKCKYSYNLTSHMKTHTERPLSCHLCEFKCALTRQLKKHLTRHTDDKPFQCELCEYRSSLKEYLTRHMRTHTDEKPFICELCKARFAWSGDLSKHMKVHSNVKTYLCEICSYNTNDSKTLVIHMRTHTGVKPFKCKFCSYTCSLRLSLRSHLKMHSDERPYSCKLCSYTSRQAGAMKIHMRTHTNEKPYKCTLCDYRATQKQHLNRHVMTHTGEKPFACIHCPYKCNRKCSLVSHLKKHQPYACDFCERKFTRKSSMTKHMASHTGGKPYACAQCNFKSAHKSSLHVHKRTHTGEKVYFTCDVCSYMTLRKKYLVTHMGKHNGLSARSPDLNKPSQIQTCG